MKTLLVLIVALICLSFTTKREEVNSKSGYYIQVADYTDRTNHEYLVESKDSANKIFDHFFASELELGTVDYPISIDNGKQSFFIARVNLFESKNGKTKFKHLKYPKIYHKRKQRGRTAF